MEALISMGFTRTAALEALRGQNRVDRQVFELIEDLRNLYQGIPTSSFETIRVPNEEADDHDDLTGRQHSHFNTFDEEEWDILPELHNINSQDPICSKLEQEWTLVRTISSPTTSMSDGVHDFDDLHSVMSEDSLPAVGPRTFAQVASTNASSQRKPGTPRAETASAPHNRRSTTCMAKVKKEVPKPMRKGDRLPRWKEASVFYM